MRSPHLNQSTARKKAAPNNVTNSPALRVKETSLDDTPENADEYPDVTMDSITSEDLEETMDYISTKNRQSEEAEMEESVRMMTKRAPSKMTPKIVKIKLRFPKRIPKVRERNQTLMTEFLNAKDDSLRTGTRTTILQKSMIHSPPHIYALNLILTRKLSLNLMLKIQQDLLLEAGRFPILMR